MSKDDVITAATAEIARLKEERDDGRIALARIGAIVGALRCSACGKLHTDLGRTPEEQEWATKPHRTHQCVDDAAGVGCGATWRQPHQDIVDAVIRLVAIETASRAFLRPGGGLASIRAARTALEEAMDRKPR